MPSRRRQEAREALVEEIHRRDKIAQLRQQVELLTQQVAALMPQQHAPRGRGRRGQVPIEEVQHRDHNIQNVTIEEITEEEEFDYDSLPVFDNEDIEEATEEEEFDYEGPPVFDNEDIEEAIEEEEFDYECPHVFDNEDTEEATEEEEFDYYGPPVFDSECVEEAAEKEEFVVGDVGQSLVVRRSFLTSLENNTDWLRTNLFQSTCTIGEKKSVLLPDKGSVEAVGDDANLLTRVKFETNMEGYGIVYVLVEKSVDSEQEVTRRIQSLLEEFHEDFPEELPDGLPPEPSFRGDNSDDDEVSTPSNSRANFSQPVENDEGKIITQFNFGFVRF
jgi:hypothetical protein